MVVLKKGFACCMRSELVYLLSCYSEFKKEKLMSCLFFALYSDLIIHTFNWYHSGSPKSLVRS